MLLFHHLLQMSMLRLSANKHEHRNDNGIQRKRKRHVSRNGAHVAACATVGEHVVVTRLVKRCDIAFRANLHQLRLTQLALLFDGGNHSAISLADAFADVCMRVHHICRKDIPVVFDDDSPVDRWVVPRKQALQCERIAIGERKLGVIYGHHQTWLVKACSARHINIRAIGKLNARGIRFHRMRHHRKRRGVGNGGADVLERNVVA